MAENERESLSGMVKRKW